MSKNSYNDTADKIVRGAVRGVADTVKGGLDLVFGSSDTYEKVGGKDSDIYIKRK